MGSVDISGVAKTGSTVETCSLDFDEARTTQADRLDPQLGGDWATGAASSTAAAAWQTFLTQLAGQVRELGQSLTTSAREFQAADAAAAGRVSGAGAGIPAGHPAQARAYGYAQ